MNLDYFTEYFFNEVICNCNGIHFKSNPPNPGYSTQKKKTTFSQNLKICFFSRMSFLLFEGLGFAPAVNLLPARDDEEV